MELDMEGSLRCCCVKQNIEFDVWLSLWLILKLWCSGLWGSALRNNQLLQCLWYPENGKHLLDQTVSQNI